MKIEVGNRLKLFLAGILAVVALVFVVQALNVENTGDFTLSSLVNCNVETNADGKFVCGTDDGILSESDPQVASTTSGKWCVGTGTQVDCTQNAPSGGSSQWTTSGSDIYYDVGNVGIGTASPNTKLRVSGGDIGLDADRIITSIANDTQAGYIELRDSGNGNMYIVPSNAGSQQRNLIIPAGNVGIGHSISTSQINYKLDVLGNINGQQLCIAGICRSSWPSGGSGGGDGVGFTGYQTVQSTLGSSNCPLGNTDPACPVGCVSTPLVACYVTSHSVNCPSGKKVIGGGCKSQFDTSKIYRSYPLDDDTWQCNADANTFITVYAICANVV